MIEKWIISKLNQEALHRIYHGMKKLIQIYKPHELESVCHYAYEHHITRYRDIEKLFKTGVYKQFESAGTAETQNQLHENIRGADYYTDKEGVTTC